MSDLREVLQNLQLAARCIPANTDDHTIMFYIRGWPFSSRDMRALANSPDFRRGARAPDGRDAVVEAARESVILRAKSMFIGNGPSLQDIGDLRIAVKRLAAIDAEKAGG